jgi:hypothetical protein
MTKNIEKRNSKSRVEIQSASRDGSLYLASYVQGNGFEYVYFEGRYFKTVKGAEKWAAKKLS